MIDELSLPPNSSDWLEEVIGESETVDKQYTFTPPPFARSAAYFAMRTGELVSWDVPGSRYNHVLRLEGDEQAMIRMCTETNIYSLDRLLSVLAANPYILPLATLLLTPPPGVGTAIGLGVSIACTIFMSSKKNYTEHNASIVQEMILGFRIPCEIIKEMGTAGLLIDYYSEHTTLIDEFLSYMDSEEQKIVEWIKEHPEEQLSVDNLVNWHLSFNTMLRKIIKSKGEFPTVEEQKLEALKVAIDAGVIVDKLPYGVQDMPIFKELAKAIADRYYLIEVAVTIGCVATESSEGLYTFFIPGTNTDKNYLIESCRSQTDLLGRKQIIYITAASELVYRTDPVRKAYYTMSKQEIEQKGIIGPSYSATSFWGGLSTISSRSRVLSGIGLDTQVLVDFNLSQNITIGPSTNLGFVVNNDTQYRLPVILQSSEPFIVSETNKQGMYIGLTEEQLEKKQFLEELPPSDWRFIFAHCLIKQSYGFEEVYRIINSLEKRKYPLSGGYASRYYVYSEVSFKIRFVFDGRKEAVLGNRASTEYRIAICRRTAENLDFSNYFSYSSNCQFFDDYIGTFNQWFNIGDTCDTSRYWVKEPNTPVLEFTFSSTPYGSKGNFWKCVGLM